MKANLTREESRERARLLSVESYDVTIDLSGTDETFPSEVTVRFECTEPGASTFADLQAASIEEATLNGRPLPESAFDGTRLKLEGLDSRNELVVRGRYPYMTTGTGLHNFIDPVDGARYAYTQFEPFEANRVFACFDQPDLKATFGLTVKVPDGSRAVGNTEATVDGSVYRFATTPPLPTYLVSVCTGPFHVVEDRHRDIPLGLWCRESLAKHLDTDELFELTKQGLDFFEKVFDSPYPFTKYDQVFCPEYKFGAMENPGCVTWAEAYIFRSKVTETARRGRANTLLHEMAHMWFGDLVTMRWWDDLWLNESFATYMAYVALDRATRFEQTWTSFATGMKAGAIAADQLPTTHPIVSDLPDVQSTFLNFDAITYNKGAAVLKQLHAWVGEEPFWEGLRDYFRRFAWGNAELADFLGALEKGSGRDLRAWSAEWLETSGVNAIRLEPFEQDGTLTAVEVKQDGRPARSHRIGIALYDNVGDELVLRRHTELDVSGERTPVKEFEGDPVPALMVPNWADLAYTKIRFDKRSLDTLTDRLHKLADPLTRSLCWAGLWDMVRDAELGARAFGRIVRNNIDSEDDVAGVQRLLGLWGGAVSAYADPSHRDEAMGELASFAFERCRTAEPGSDFQLAWAQTAISCARTSEHNSLLKRLLDGSERIEGLTIDTDRRWQIVSVLAKAGEFGDSEIAAEAERDPTDIGRRRAAAARAARPDAESKAGTWEELTRFDDPLPLAELRARMAGFWAFDQDEILEPYAERYFQAVPEIWSGTDIDRALDFARGMYPGAIATEDTVRRSDALLDAGQIAPPLRRVLLEGSDNVKRTIAARARDAADG